MTKAAPAVLMARKIGLLGSSGQPVLHDVSIDLRVGERLAIIGPNGAGKTSLVRVLAGLTRASSGEVLVEGRRLREVPVAIAARRRAFVAQHERPDPRLSVIEYVGLGRVPHRRFCSAEQDRSAVMSAMVRAGVAVPSHRRLGTLSGGEQQRVVIARAIAQEPSVLILDEPTNHLDLQGRAEILRLVRDLGIAVVAVLHDLSLVAAFADRVAVLHSGRLVVHAAVDVALTPHMFREVFNLGYLELQDPATGTRHGIFDHA